MSQIITTINYMENLPCFLSKLTLHKNEIKTMQISIKNQGPTKRRGTWTEISDHICFTKSSNVKMSPY